MTGYPLQAHVGFLALPSRDPFRAIWLLARWLLDSPAIGRRAGEEGLGRLINPPISARAHQR